MPNRKSAICAAIAVALVPLLVLTTPVAAAHTTPGKGSTSLLPRTPHVASLSSGSNVCPRPSLTMYGSHPSSVLGPFPLGVAASRAFSHSIGGSSTFAATCRWRLSFNVHHHDPVVYVVTGTPIYLVPGVVNEFFDNGSAGGVICTAYYQIDNGYGGAAAQSWLQAGNCNTDGFTKGEGTVVIDDAALRAGPTVSVAPSFHQWYVSYVFGANSLVGVFTFCSEDPPGQHQVYACVQFDAGPYEYD